MAPGRLRTRLGGSSGFLAAPAPTLVELDPSVKVAVARGASEQIMYDGDFLSFPFETTFPLPVGGRTVRIELVEGSAERTKRTYTVALDGVLGQPEDSR